MAVDDRLGGLVILEKAGRSHRLFELLDLRLRVGDPGFQVRDSALSRFVLLPGASGFGVRLLLVLVRGWLRPLLSDIRCPISDRPGLWLSGPLTGAFGTDFARGASAIGYRLSDIEP